MPKGDVPPAPGVDGPSLRSPLDSTAPQLPPQTVRQSPSHYGSSRTFVSTPTVFDKIRGGFRRLRSLRVGRRQRNVVPTPMNSGLQPQPDPYFPQADPNHQPVGFGGTANPPAATPMTPSPVRGIPETQTEAHMPLQRVPQSEIDVEAWPYAKEEPRQSVAMQSRDGIFPPNFRPAVYGLPENDIDSERLTVRPPSADRRPAGFPPARTGGRQSVAHSRRERSRTPRHARDYRSVSHGHTAPRLRSGPQFAAPELEAPLIRDVDSALESPDPSASSSSSSSIGDRPIRSRNFR